MHEFGTGWRLINHFKTHFRFAKPIAISPLSLEMLFTENCITQMVATCLEPRCFFSFVVRMIPRNSCVNSFEHSNSIWRSLVRDKHTWNKVSMTKVHCLEMFSLETDSRTQESWRIALSSKVQNYWEIWIWKSGCRINCEQIKAVLHSNWGSSRAKE